MLVTMKAVLDIAEAKNAAVGAFNVTTLEALQAVLSAAEDRNEPVIIQFAQAHKVIIPLEVMGPIMLLMAEKSSVPVCVHLDHGEDLATIHKALEMGFTSVMFDGSMLPYEENIALTKAVVELASEYGASVEAEIGAMGHGELGCVGAEGEEVAAVYTDPDMAQDFVMKTGIDALACSFGTSHGIYKTTPKLDFPRIETIRQKIGIPIVMHGGSGIGDEEFKKCIDRGVRKINFYTYSVKAAGETVKEKCNASDDVVFFHDISIWARETMKQTFTHAMRIFANKNE